MATVMETTFDQRVGEAAGAIWQLLDSQGPMTITELVKQVDTSRDLAMQAMGWLAREDKINVDEQARKKIVSLR